MTAPRRLRRLAVVVASATVAVSAVGCGRLAGLGDTPQQPSTASATPTGPPLTIHGYVAVRGLRLNWLPSDYELKTGGTCHTYDDRPYDAVGTGEVVRVTDGYAVLGSGHLETGRVAKGGDGFECRYAFTIAGVPADRAAYVRTDSLAWGPFGSDDLSTDLVLPAGTP